ncbi:PilZ domain-containing protein [Sulfurospirillum arcachonense]|uniref:PilZ domain-containing protein n=1 Tax=Sulfurospirillum arcachonense TaxID=57666 RepID=UPI000468335F|nr:PilZ domain-containing protein [Sulfurospirillum arcachonense]
MIERSEIDSFLECSSEFIDKYELEFIDYFVSLYESHDKSYPQKTIQMIAKLIYKDFFNIDIFFTTNEKDIFIEMKDKGIMLNFLITKSILFLLTNYIKESTEKHLEYEKYMGTFVSFISEYLEQFATQISNKNRHKIKHVNFDRLDNFSPGHNIIDIFKDIKDNGEEVIFFNLYKGIPIRHSAIVMNIEDNEVTFKTIQIQGIAMKMDGVAYILKDNNFNNYVKADIVYNDFSNNIVVLKNFNYLLNMPATQREAVRVYPEIMAEVVLLSDKESMTKGKLYDLSVAGVGVVSESNNGIYAGAKIELNIPLKINNTQEVHLIKVEGEVLNIIEYRDSYRYCIKIYPELDEKDKIIDYVKFREKEILNSLNQELKDYNF